MKNIISILLENEFGALSRVIGLFSQRGYNIDSLTVAPTKNKKISLVTIKIKNNKKCIKQIQKQLKKLINVLKVYEIKKKKYIKIETILIKTKKITKEEKKKIFNKEDKKIIIFYKNSKYSIIQITTKAHKIKKIIKNIIKFKKIKEISKSGIISIPKKKIRF